MKCKSCIQFEQQLKTVKEQLELVQYELAQYKMERYPKKKSRVGDDKDEKKPSKKKGGLFGHQGWFRKKPKKFDRVEEVKLTQCPHCKGHELIEYKDQVDEHIQEDIILPQQETVLYRKRLYYCKRCKKEVMGKGQDELPNSYIGPVAKTLSVFLKFNVKISDRDIQKMFKQLFHLKIVHSSIVGFRSQLKRHALPLYEKLIQALKEGRFIHADETGTRIDGENGWQWKFSNKKISITHTDLRRGQGVVEDILGEKYDGVLISDFLGAYNKILTQAKQRCLVHILRDLKRVLEYWSQDQEIIRYCERLKSVFESAIELYKEYQNKKWDLSYQRRRTAIQNSLNDFSFPNPNLQILQRFAKRLKRHKNELFTFLYVKGIDYHNNHAEQQIRPDVLLRKITFGNRSMHGAEMHDVAMSVIQTARLNHLDPFVTLKNIFLTGSKSVFSGIVSSP